MMTKAVKEVRLPSDMLAALLKVREMRTAQKFASKFHYKPNVRQSRRLEAEVDELLDQLKITVPQQEVTA